MTKINVKEAKKHVAILLKLLDSYKENHKTIEYGYNNMMKYWKDNRAPKYAVLLEGARRVGKTTIAEEFAKQEYRSYIKIDFANITKDVYDAFDDIANPDIFFLRLQTATGITLYRRES